MNILSYSDMKNINYSTYILSSQRFLFVGRSYKFITESRVQINRYIDTTKFIRIYHLNHKMMIQHICKIAAIRFIENHVIIHVQLNLSEIEISDIGQQIKFNSRWPKIRSSQQGIHWNIQNCSSLGWNRILSRLLVTIVDEISGR